MTLMTEKSEELETLSRDGFCVLRGVIPPDEVAAVRESVQRAVLEHAEKPLPQAKVTGLLRVDQSIAGYLADPRIMAIMRELFGKHVRISMLTGLVTGPGLKRGVVHADWPFKQSNASCVPSPYPDVVMNIVTMWMLSDYTVDNGGTIVVPGSHKRDESPHENGRYSPTAEYEGEVRLTGKAGDVGLFDARTWHAAAANQTDQPRVGVIVRYAPWWLNTNVLRPGSRDRHQVVEQHGGQDNEVKLLSRETYDQLPDDVKPLVYHLIEDEP